MPSPYQTNDAFMLPSPRHRRISRPLFNEFHVEATAFLLEIVRAADCLREARAFDGTQALHFGARGRLGMPDFGWVFTLLNGLEPSAMRETSHVLRVLRQRLERYHREMRRVAR